MGKKETKAELKDTKAQSAAATKQFDTLSQQNTGRQADLDANAAQTRTGAVDAYSGFVNKPAKTYQNVSFSPQSVSAAHVTAQHNSLPGYKDFSETGGYNDEAKAPVNQSVAGLQEMGRTGGLDDASMARMRGGGVYDEFAKTGGLSDVDRGNIRAKALSPISAMNTSMNDELQRRRAVQGGYAPGFDASSRALRRDTARNIAGTSLDAELGITDRVNQGRQWGAGGMTSSEGQLQNLRTGNMMAGLTGAGNMSMALQNAINSGKLSGLGGIQANDASDLQAGTFNAGADNSASMFNAQQALQAEMAAANLNQQGQQYTDDYNQRGQMFGASGLGNIFNTDNAVAQSNIDRGLDIVTQEANAQMGFGGLSTQLAMRPSGWEQAAAAGAGIAGGLAGGMKIPGLS